MASQQYDKIRKFANNFKIIFVGGCIFDKVLTVEYVKQDKIGTSFSGLLIFVFTKEQCVEFIFEVKEAKEGFIE